MWFEFKMHYAKSQTSFRVGKMNIISLKSTTEMRNKECLFRGCWKALRSCFVPELHSAPGLLYWWSVASGRDASVQLYVNNGCYGVSSVDDVSVSVNARCTTAAQSRLG